MEKLGGKRRGKKLQKEKTGQGKTKPQEIMGRVSARKRKK
jgi:hypothetical protein